MSPRSGLGIVRLAASWPKKALVMTFFLPHALGMVGTPSPTFGSVDTVCWFSLGPLQGRSPLLTFNMSPVPYCLFFVTVYERILENPFFPFVGFFPLWHRRLYVPLPYG